MEAFCRPAQQCPTIKKVDRLYRSENSRSSRSCCGFGLSVTTTSAYAYSSAVVIDELGASSSERSSLHGTRDIFRTIHRYYCTVPWLVVENNPNRTDTFARTVNRNTTEYAFDVLSYPLPCRGAPASLELYPGLSTCPARRRFVHHNEFRAQHRRNVSLLHDARVLSASLPFPSYVEPFSCATIYE